MKFMVNADGSDCILTGKLPVLLPLLHLTHEDPVRSQLDPVE